MYNIFGDILSFDLLNLGAEATTAIDKDFIDWGGVALNFGVYIAVVVATIYIQKNKKQIKLKRLSVPVFALIAFVLCQAIGVSLFSIQTAVLKTSASSETEIETSDRYLWDNFQFKTDAFKKFGYFGFYTKSIYNVLLKNDNVNIEEYQAYIDSGVVEGNTSAQLYGDNLIVILCESLDWFAIDPINTPTLYEMSQGNNTIVLKEFYARNRTNYSEGITLLGSVPKNITIPNAFNSGYKFEYSLPRLFKEANDDKQTTTAYFHDNYANFYERGKVYGSDGIGFEQLYFEDSYTGDQEYKGFGQWRTDYSFVENLLDKFIPDSERFLTYFASISTHGPYNTKKENLQEYYDLFDENFEGYSTWVAETQDYTIPQGNDFELFRNYKTAFIDLDRTVKLIIDTLQEKGLYESTSIVLYADHNSYYHDLCYKVKGIKKSDYSNTYINNIPVLIHSPKIAGDSGIMLTDYTNTYDILPTICDLYGLKQNTNLFQGYSIFSEDIKNSFFASNLSGMFTNNIYSTNISDVYKKDDGVTDEEVANFKKNANRFFKKQEKLEIIYKYGINGTI
jgi:phosphoglycerol transferase MdoB-like AlkP superfamily enzyme